MNANVGTLFLCERCNSLTLLYEIAKIIAETDSIAEGVGYSPSYIWEEFKKELEDIRNYNYRESYALVALGIYDIIKKTQELREGGIL